MTCAGRTEHPQGLVGEGWRGVGYRSDRITSPVGHHASHGTMWESVACPPTMVPMPGPCRRRRILHHSRRPMKQRALPQY